MLTPQQQEQINDQQSRRFTTRRVTVPALEEILYHPFPVLDHGFVRVVDYCGSDASIVQSARVSYGTGTKKVSEDRGLLRYLMRHHHTTPFEMCEITLHVKLPMFVARQWIRHRTANVNEYSARYSILDDEFYLPDAQNLAVQSAANRQGRDEAVDPAYAEEVREILRKDAEQAYAHYLYLLNEEGEEGRPKLARELARMNLPVNWYTQWYWKVDLHNLLRFLSLRADSHAQYEIRAYAQTILDQIVKVWVPDVWQAFMDYRVGGCGLSAPALAVVKAWLSGEDPQQQDSGLSPREWQELLALFDRKQEP